MSQRGQVSNTEAQAGGALQLSPGTSPQAGPAPERGRDRNVSTSREPGGGGGGGVYKLIIIVNQGKTFREKLGFVNTLKMEK